MPPGSSPASSTRSLGQRAGVARRTTRSASGRGGSSSRTDSSDGRRGHDAARRREVLAGRVDDVDRLGHEDDPAAVGAGDRRAQQARRDVGALDARGARRRSAPGCSPASASDASPSRSSARALTAPPPRAGAAMISKRAPPSGLSSAAIVPPKARHVVAHERQARGRCRAPCRGRARRGRGRSVRRPGRAPRRRDARPGVVDVDDHARVARATRCTAAAPPPYWCGVDDEVRHRRARTGAGRPSTRASPRSPSTAISGSARRVAQGGRPHALAHELDRRHLLDDQRRRAGVAARDLEQVLDQDRKIEVGGEQVEALLGRRGRARRGAVEHRGRRGQGGQRAAQLVAHVAREARVALHALDQPADHRVERLGEGAGPRGRPGRPRAAW